MVVTLIATTILIGSLVGLVLMIVRKAPLLKTLSVEESTGLGFLSHLKQRIKQNGFIKNFSWQKILRKLLLRTERQANCWLKKLKERTAASKAILSDDYWKELKKSTRLAGSISIEKEGGVQEPEEVKITVKKRTKRVRKKNLL